MPTVSQRWDILSLIQHYASIDIVGKATVHGVLEYHSNCPFCPGSKDSFIMRPELGDYSHAIRSSGCGRHGDAYDFLKEYCNMSHQEALEVLGLEINGDFVPPSPSISQQDSKEDPPNKQWQETGKLLVERAARCLWSPTGKDALDYLHSRGLGDEIIKKKKLGYVPLQKDGKYYESELEDWGLDPEQVAKDKVRVPNGILIPWFEGSTLWRLALKRPDQPKGKDYGQVIGSGEGLFNVGEIQCDFPVMMVESEICAMSVEQEAGDLVSCVATGSTTRGRLSRWLAELQLASCVLQSFDEDDSGDIGSEYWMQTLKEKCQRWSPYVAKDPNDILLKKFLSDRWECSLREWVEAGIATQREYTLPFALPLQAGEPVNPLAGGEVSLLQARNRLKPWTKRDLQMLDGAFAHTKWYGPEADMKALTIQGHIESHLAPGICLNKNCPCEEVWGEWVTKQALSKKK